MSTTPRFWILAAFVTGLASCGGSSSGSNCIPGQSAACVGPGACRGAQICAADGRSFGSCVCSVDASSVDAMDASPGSDAAVSADGALGADGSDVRSDAATPVPDAAPDVVVDGGPSDAPASESDAGATPSPTLTPAQHDFGPVAVGAMSAPFTFLVANPSASAAISTLEIAVDGSDFTVSATGNTCAGMSTLAPGGRCSIDVLFKPGTRGLKQGALIARAGGAQVTASLTGTAEAPAAFAISPMSPEFAGTVGVTGAPLTVFVANVGDAQSGQVTVALGGPDANQFKLTSDCLAPLPGSGTCTATVTFSPTAAGMKTATLTVSSPVGGSAMATLTGTAGG